MFHYPYNNINQYFLVYNINQKKNIIEYYYRFIFNNLFLKDHEYISLLKYIIYDKKNKKYRLIKNDTEYYNNIDHDTIYFSKPPIDMQNKINFIKKKILPINKLVEILKIFGNGVIDENIFYKTSILIYKIYQYIKFNLKKNIYEFIEVDDQLINDIDYIFI